MQYEELQLENKMNQTKNLNKMKDSEKEKYHQMNILI